MMDTAHGDLHQPGTRGLGLLAGISLLLLGGVVLLVQYPPTVVPALDLGHYGWPFFVIVPGLLLLAGGLATRAGAGLSVAGSIVAMAGLLLLVQNTFDLFATWAYAWALVAVVAPGIALFLQGTVTGQRRLREAGAWVAGFGAVLFVLGAAFFEGIVHLSGLDLGSAGRVLLPAVLITVGVFLLARNRKPAADVQRGDGTGLVAGFDTRADSFTRRLQDGPKSVVSEQPSAAPRHLLEPPASRNSR
jgi:4-amino-4-deoxy-L-arabinose transferase-like glycosyltransferase